MFGKMVKKSSLCLAASLILGVAPTVWASSVCESTGTVSTVGSGTTTIQVGVAANFTNMFTTWLNNYFFNSSYNPNYSADAAAYTIQLCSDSTTNLENAITAKTYKPSLLFAADNSADGLGNENMEYAEGYPTFLGYTSGKTYTVTGISELISGLSGTYADVSADSTGLASYSVGSALTGSTTPVVAIADPTKAPYGLKAEYILNDLQPIEGSGTSMPTTVPAWIAPLSTYSSVTKSYNAIGTSVPAGFLAFSQFCQAPPANAVWVRFTNQYFWTDQWVANYEAYSSSPSGGTEIYNLINTEKNDTNHTWLNFVTTDYGYGSCYATD